MQQFAADIRKIRERARKYISDGAVTGGYKDDRAQVIKILNHVLATEIVRVPRYKRHYYMASGINSDGAKAEFPFRRHFLIALGATAARESFSAA